MDANKFISQHIFDGIIDLEVFETDYQYLDTKYAIVVIKVDHSKLWRGSKNFDESYYKRIFDIDNGVYSKALSEIIPMVGFDHDIDYEPAIKYKHINTDVYNVLENKIYDLGYDVELQVAPYSPWPIVYIDCDDNSDIEFIIESLEKMGYDVDDIVFSDDY